jgi:hypothetical protein
MERRDVGFLAESMVGFIKGLYSPQKAPVVDAKQEQEKQLVNEHEMQQKEAAKLDIHTF